MSHSFTHKKLTRSHTSLIEAAEGVIKRATQMPEVSKISLGVIKQISVGKPRIKFLPMTGGIRSIIRGNASIQEIFIYTTDETKTVKVLKDFFEGN
jgi:hypothetical protein